MSEAIIVPRQTSNDIVGGFAYNCSGVFGRFHPNMIDRRLPTSERAATITAENRVGRTMIHSLEDMNEYMASRSMAYVTVYMVGLYLMNKENEEIVLMVPSVLEQRVFFDLFECVLSGEALCEHNTVTKRNDPRELWIRYDETHAMDDGELRQQSAIKRIKIIVFGAGSRLEGCAPTSLIVLRPERVGSADRQRLYTDMLVPLMEASDKIDMLIWSNSAEVRSEMNQMFEHVASALQERDNESSAE